MFSRILIANRGEIAVRIERTCRDLGIECVAVHSDVDAVARHVELADAAVHLRGVAAVDTYLDQQAIIRAALDSEAEAIHPGYGFLAESAGFAAAVVDAGLVWIGPPPGATRAVGDKIAARRIAETAGVPVVPGLSETVEPEAIAAFARDHGFPLAIKAAGGGGGRGLRIVRTEEEIAEAFASVRREAEAYFGSRDVFVEKYLEEPKHLEVQVLSIHPDEALWLGARDCSLQRRHQKLIEETPPPRFAGSIEDMGRAAVALAEACGYVNAGTCEFLGDAEGSFYFLEMNARLQVEHTVTEEVYGVDLVEAQLRIAAGDDLGFGQADLVGRGHAIECRINAEDPARSFAPAPGRLTTYSEPSGIGIRVDSGYREGDEIPGAYDSLIAKVIAWAPDREGARQRMLRALDEFRVEGVSTTIPAHRALLEADDFVSGIHHTRSVEGSNILDALSQLSEETKQDVLLVDGRAVRLWNPAMAASAAAAVHEDMGMGGEVDSPMQGTILKVLVEPGQEISAGDPVAILEAMKMETTLTAPAGGVIAEVRVQPGAAVAAGEVLVWIEKSQKP